MNEGITFSITKGELWTALAIVFVIFIIISGVFIHHWNYYGIRDNKKTVPKSIFFVGAAFIFVILMILITLI